MPRHIRREFAGAKYHVTNRGNGRQQIFGDPVDCDRFMEQLVEAQAKEGVVIYAYCLMPNHFHLFLETPRANLGRFMGRLTTAYAMYWRHRHRKSGHCFQNRYKAPLVQGDMYALALTRYIHLNPVKTRKAADATPSDLWKKVVAYPWSSIRGYLETTYAAEMVDYRWLQAIGEGCEETGRRAYEGYLRGFLVQDDEDILKVMSAGQYGIGDDEFRREMEEWTRAQGRRRRHQSDVVIPPQEPIGMEKIESAVTREFGVKSDVLRQRHSRQNLARDVFIELACSVGGLTQRELATYLGTVTEHGVGKARHNLRLRLASDKSIESRVERTRKRLC